MSQTSFQQAALMHARDLAVGVSALSEAMGVEADELDRILHGVAPIPDWMFLWALDYIRASLAERVGVPQQPAHLPS